MKSQLRRLSEALIAFCLVIALFIATGPLSAGQAAGGDAGMGSSWKFRVYLDEKEIGYHHFYLVESGETRQLKSVASFEYSLMFVRLFHYEHENNEIWNGDCLQSIDSQTNANGESFQVNGRRTNGEFRVSANGGEESLPECVMSFAYWNPSFLEQSNLLNTQDGEFLDVEFSEPVFEELPVVGGQRPSYRYHLAAGDLKLDLWYSADRQWLALESEVRGGRKLRYVLDDQAQVQAGEYSLNTAASLAHSGAANNRAEG
jgi:hypothetical protein